MINLSPRHPHSHYVNNFYQHKSNPTSVENESIKVKSVFPFNEKSLLDDDTVTQERVEAHPINNFGYPKPGSAHGLKPEYVLARALQRNPNARVRENLNRLHFNISQRFNDMSSESIEWLLGGSRNTCRGGLANANEFRAFLNTDPRDIPPAQLISRLESISSAIGYRAVSDRRQEEPIVPETPCQKEMYRVISEITNGQLVASINTVYVQRISDRVNGKTSLDEINVTSCEQDEELSDDEDDAYRGQPNIRIPTAQFKVFREQNQPSWIYRAKQNGVYVRNDVSGTTPVTLAATTGLLRGQGGSHSAILDNEEEARELFTALFMPKFLRSDYHSLAETQAGIDHFIAEHNFKRDNTFPKSREIDPLTAESRAYVAMCNAACNEDYQYGMTPRQSMENYLSIDSRLLC